MTNTGDVYRFIVANEKLEDMELMETCIKVLDAEYVKNQ